MTGTTNEITTGVTGGGWRATVTAWGAVEPWRDGAVLDWHIAADDRWHSPQREAAVRQRRIDGTAVVETRVRIPDGDAVQRVYSVPDHGGLTIIEVENESPLPIAVAFTHAGLLSVRPPTAPIEGISLPEGSVAFPVGHHSTLVVAIAHDGRGAGPLPHGMPTVAGVVRGWLTTVERASRLLLPDGALNERVVAERCELGDLLLDLGEARVEEIAHVLAGSSAAVADVEDLADLGEGEARGLAAVDEVDPGGRLGRVVAVSGRRALGRGQQALLLVEPQRLRRRSRPLGEFPDAHRRPPFLSAEAFLTFPCTGRSSMAEKEEKPK